jgi:hypothetical protein
MISSRWDGDYLPMLVRKSFSSRAKARAKAAGGLPVREIGEVIFADGFRQLVAPKFDEGGSFAGIRVQALPFFRRRVIRQWDG